MVTEAEVDCVFVKAWVGRGDVPGALLPCAPAPAAPLELEDAIFRGCSDRVEPLFANKKRIT